MEIQMVTYLFGAGLLAVAMVAVFRDAQSTALQGRGIADHRQVIVAGLGDSLNASRRSVPGTTASM